jgi:hypothetical protein
MASLRPCLALVPRTIGRRQFSLTQRKRLQDNWDQEALPGSNVPFNSKKKASPLKAEQKYSIFFSK